MEANLVFEVDGGIIRLNEQSILSEKRSHELDSGVLSLFLEDEVPGLEARSDEDGTYYTIRAHVRLLRNKSPIILDGDIIEMSKRYDTDTDELGDFNIDYLDGVIELLETFDEDEHLGSSNDPWWDDE
jgi:hypothetical protein